MERVPTEQDAASAQAENDLHEDVRSRDCGKRPMRPRELRRLISKYSALLVIFLPTFLSAIYYGVFASDQYAVEVRFAVRGVSAASGGSDLVSMVTGISSSGSTTADSYILMDYIQSREILERLRKNIPLNDIYGREKGDFLSAFDFSNPIEKFVKYWRRALTISYDTSSQIIVVEVRAFTPQDAKIE